MLRFIYGGTGSGKSYFCYEDIKKKLEKGQKGPFIIMVPQQNSFEAQKKLLDFDLEKYQRHCEILDFGRLCHKVLRVTGGLSRKHISPSGREILISYIIDKNHEEFKAYRGVYNKKGFVKSISDTMSELKKFGVTPEILSIFSSNTKDMELQNKINDISIIYKNYEEYLHEKYIDQDDDLIILKEKLKEYEDISSWEVYIDGFSNFNALQYGILEELLLRCKKVTMSLTLTSEKEKEQDVFSITKATEEKLINIISRNNISLDKPVNLKKPYRRFIDSKELSHLEENLYAYPHKVYEDEMRDISLYLSANPYSEVEALGRAITSLVRDKNVKYEDIGVVLREMGGYEGIIPAVFREYNIPFFMDKKKDIDGNVLVMFITALLDIVDKNWSYEAVFKYLKTGLTELNKEDIDLLENYVLACGIKGKKNYDEDVLWKYNPYGTMEEEEEAEYLNKINNIKNNFAKPVKDFHVSIKKCKNVREMCTLLFNFLVSLKINSKVEAMVNEFKARGDLYESDEYRQIWNKFLELLDQMVEALGEEDITVDSFKRYLSAGLTELKIGFIPLYLDEVTVGTIDRIKSSKIKYIFVLGVNDGIFPKTIKEDPMLNDKDRELLKNAGIQISRDSRAAVYDEQFLVYETLLRGSKALNISFSAADIEGNALRPSVIIGRLKNIFPKIIEKTDAAGNINDMELVSAINPSFNNLLLNSRELSKKDCSEELLAVYKYIEENDKDKFNFIKRAMGYTNMPEKLTKKSVQELYGKKFNVSVSRLEKFISCPFSFYMQYGLKGKERKKYGLTMPDLGSFMHKAILIFSESLKEDNKKWGEAEGDYIDKKADNIINGMLLNKESSIFLSIPRFSYASLRLKRVLTKTLKLLCAQFKYSAFEPFSFEARFGKGGEYPPVVIELPDKTIINIEGIIDRIDICTREDGTYVRIVDYKSSEMMLRLSDVYNGLQLQLLLYLDAVLSKEGDVEQGFYPAGVLYFKIDDPIIKDNGEMPEDKLSEAIFKSFKMNGLLLKDKEIIKAMDENIKTTSYVIPAGIKKSGELTDSSKAATLEEFNLLRDHVRSLIYESCIEISKGDISIKPYKKGNKVPCEYCLYGAVCGFENGILNNSYRILKDKKDNEVFDALRMEAEKDE